MSKSLPGLAGCDHIGFTVPDLEIATRFLSMSTQDGAGVKLKRLFPTPELDIIDIAGSDHWKG